MQRIEASGSGALLDTSRRNSVGYAAKQQQQQQHQRSSVSSANGDSAEFGSRDFLRQSVNGNVSGNVSGNDSYLTPQPKAYQPASAASNRTSAMYEELNTLPFQKLGLYGRDEELNTLQDVYQTLTVAGTGTSTSTTGSNSKGTTSNSKGTSPTPLPTAAAESAKETGSTKPLNWILVRGSSGTGKTALVKAFVSRLQEKQDAPILFCMGRYDAYLSSPHGAFVSAFSQLLQDLPFHPLYESQIEPAILQAVGEDCKFLLDLIPNLGELIFRARDRRQAAADKAKAEAQTNGIINDGATGTTSTTTTTTATTTDPHVDLSSNYNDDDMSYDMVKSKEKFKFLLQRFLQAVCQPQHRVILFLDDIQWMDPASLQLLEVILNDRSLEQSLLIVSTIRNSEEDWDEQEQGNKQAGARGCGRGLGTSFQPSSHNNHNNNNKKDQPPTVAISKLVQRIQETRNKKATYITLGNLPLETVESYLVDLLKLDRDADANNIQEFARIAYNRVQGNAFFLVQFITALRDGGYLKFSISKMKWEWDGADILRRSTVVAQNVLQVLMEKMQLLPHDAKVVLQVVGCLGASFDEDLVTLVVNELEESGLLTLEPEPNSDHHQHDNSTTKRKRTPKEILQSLEEEGILEAFQERTLQAKQSQTRADGVGVGVGVGVGNIRSRSFCYSHSQIGFAAHELMDGELMPKLKLTIGQILYLHKEQMESNGGLLFTIVDLWNEGSELISGSEETRVLIDLNVQAGKKALESFAFGASCNYFLQALDWIPEHKRWEEEYELSMDIYNCLIKAEYSNGTGNLGEHCQEVMQLKGRPIMDKIVAYTAMITALGIGAHRHIDAILLSVQVLKELGVKFSLGVACKFAILGGLIKTKKLLSKVPLDTLLTQREMTDQRRLVALDIMATVNSSLYAASPDLLFCTVLKTLRWSLKYGISKDTAKCVSFYGLVEMAMGNAEAGSKACKLAVQLAEKQNLMRTEYSPTSAVYGFVLPWTNPLHTCANQLLLGYNAGLETGDLHYGFMNITLYCFFSYCTGKPFSNLEEDMREYARQMKEYSQFLQLQFLSLTWQTILNLMGRCDGDPAVLTGEVMEYEEMLHTADVDKCPPLRAQVQCHQLELAVYYRDFELAAKMIRPAASISMANPANPIIWRNALFEGIAAFELVGRGQKKWKKTALKAIAKTQKWVDAGNVNCVHILYLLQAEKAAMEKKTEDARQLFERAIVTAARNGYRNDRAIATERCAEMYAVLGDEFWFNDYFQKAIDAYKEIEAFGKVEQMMEEPRQMETPKPCFEISLVNEEDLSKDKSDQDFKPIGGDHTTVSDLTSLRFEEPSVLY